MPVSLVMGPDGELQHGRVVVMTATDVARLMALMRRGDRTSAESMELRSLSLRLNRATAGAATVIVDGERQNGEPME
jgi:hypothetical protein